MAMNNSNHDPLRLALDHLARQDQAMPRVISVVDPKNLVVEHSVNVETLDERCLTVLLADHSRSMGQGTPAPIALLNKDLPVIRDDAVQDQKLRDQMELCCIPFDDTVERGVPFVPIGEWVPPTLELGGGTSLARAINFALDVLEERAKIHQSLGVPVKFRILMCLTDGEGNGEDEEAQKQRAAQRIQEAEKAGGFLFFPVGVTRKSLEILTGYTTKRQPLPLANLRFRNLFRWLVASVREASLSTTSRLRLPNPIIAPNNLEGWAEA
jgi:uncharacterized protein YegL